MTLHFSYNTLSGYILECETDGAMGSIFVLSCIVYNSMCTTSSTRFLTSVTRRPCHEEENVWIRNWNKSFLTIIQPLRFECLFVAEWSFLEQIKFEKFLQTLSSIHQSFSSIEVVCATKNGGNRGQRLPKRVQVSLETNNVRNSHWECNSILPCEI